METQLSRMLPERARREVRMHGWRGLAAALWSRCVWELDTVLVFHATPGAKPGPEPGAEIGFLSYEQAMELPEIREHAGEDLHCREVRRQHECCVIRLGGSPAAWGWYGTGVIYDHGLRRIRRLEPGVFYSYNAYTLPPQRGRGLQTAVKRAILERISAQGGKRLEAVVNRANAASAKALENAGFRLDHALVLVSLFGIRKCFRKRV